MQLPGQLWNHFGIETAFALAFSCTLGSLWVTLGSLGGRLGAESGSDPTLGHFAVTLGPLWAHFAQFGGTSVSLWGHFGATLGSLWGRSGVTLGHFGVTLGSLWVTLGSNPGLIRFWTAPCAKTIAKPMDF